MIGSGGSGSIFENLDKVLNSIKDIAENVIPEQTRKGMFQAASELLNDADRVEPKTPKKEGHLRGSKHIEISPTEIYVGFNISYASYVHEMVPLESYGEKSITWSEPGSGAKYLESKMTMFLEKYLQIIAASWTV